MNKKSKKPLEDKVKEQIEVLNREIAERQQKLAVLCELLEEKVEPVVPVNPLPDNMTLMQAIMGVFRENSGKPMRVQDIVRAIEKKYDSKQERRTVQSTTQYLAGTKGLLEKVPEVRGLYRVVQKDAPAS